jgi:hypothetical protein
MSSLNYLMEPPHNYAADDMNAEAFELVSKIIGGHDTIEEYLACNICSLSATWDLGDVEKAEAPLSKVIIPLSKASATKASCPVYSSSILMLYVQCTILKKSSSQSCGDFGEKLSIHTVTEWMCNVVADCPQVAAGVQGLTGWEYMFCQDWLAWDQSFNLIWPEVSSETNEDGDSFGEVYM